MFGFVKHRGLSINHPLGKLGFPEKLPDAELDALVTKIRAGEATRKDKNRIIDGHVRLAISIAAGFAARASHHMSEILVAEAMYALTCGVECAHEKLIDNNITPFLSARINSLCFRTLTRQQVVHVPYSTIKTRQGRGLGTVVPTMHHVDLKVPDRSGNLHDLRDMIQTCVHDAFEAEVIKRRELGFKDDEIAEQLQCGRATVQRARQGVYSKFKKLEAELD